MPGEQQRPPDGFEETSQIVHEAALGFEVIEISGHALARMRQRRATVRDVLRTLRKPDQTGLPTQPDRKAVLWNKTARVAIEVVYEEMSDRLFIWTVIVKTRRLIDRKRP
jgi:Domain of unknown function (DUF4258)